MGLAAMLLMRFATHPVMHCRAVLRMVARSQVNVRDTLTQARQTLEIEVPTTPLPSPTSSPSRRCRHNAHHAEAVTSRKCREDRPWQGQRERERQREEGATVLVLTSIAPAIASPPKEPNPPNPTLPCCCCSLPAAGKRVGRGDVPAQQPKTSPPVRAPAWRKAIRPVARVCPRRLARWSRRRKTRMVCADKTRRAVRCGALPRPEALGRRCSFVRSSAVGGWLVTREGRVRRETSRVRGWALLPGNPWVVRRKEGRDGR